MVIEDRVMQNVLLKEMNDILGNIFIRFPPASQRVEATLTSVRYM